MRKAAYRFILDPKIAIETKRSIAPLAVRHTQTCVANVNRTSVGLIDAQKRMAVLCHALVRLLETDQLEEDHEEREDLRMTREAMALLDQAARIINPLRLRLLASGVALEEALDPVYHQPTKGTKPVPMKAKLTSPAKAVGPLESRTAAPKVSDIPRIKTTQTPEDTPEPIPEPVEPKQVPMKDGDQPKVTLRLDPRLMLRAKKEMRNRQEAKEKAEN